MHSNYPSIRRSTLRICAGLLAIPLLGLTVRGTTILTDNFTSATTTGTTGVGGGTGYITSSTTYYSTNINTGGGPITLVANNTAPISGNALRFSGYSSNSTGVASFSTVNLGLGQFITISVDYYSTSGTGTPFLGLYNDGGTPLAANLYGQLDGTGPTSALHGDKGYNFVKTLGVTTDDIRIYSELPSQWKPLQFRTNNGVALGSAASSGISGGGPVNMSLTLARELNGDLSITATYGAFSTKTTVTAASVLTTSFNELALAGYGESYFDNISITTGTSPIPEASTAALLTGAVALAFVGARRSR